MLNWFRQVDEILRGERTRKERLDSATLDISAGGIAVAVVLLAGVYGLFMGSFALARGIESGNATTFHAGWMQMIASSVKMPLLFICTLGITFPSLYVFNALVGSRLRLSAVMRLLIATLAVNVAVLASLGPIVAFFSVSTPNYPFVLLLNVVVCAGAGFLGLAFLLQTLHRLAGPRELEESDEPVDTVTRFEQTKQGPLHSMRDQPLGRHVKKVFFIWLFVFGVVGTDGLGVATICGKPTQGVSMAATARVEFLRSRQPGFLEPVVMKSRLRAMFGYLDVVLRHGVLVDGADRATASRFNSLFSVIVCCGLLYGIGMGSYAWVSRARSLQESLPQMSYSGIKVPLLLLATFALTWPAFAVISTLCGLRDDLGFLSGLVMSSQATGAIILLSFAPIVLFAYVSVHHSQTTYSAAVMLNFVLFAVASLASQWTLRRNIKSFARADRRHAIMLWFWVILYGFAGIQMAWIMRPFIGQPNAETTFFRAESWDNAYIKLVEIVRSLVLTGN